MNRLLQKKNSWRNRCILLFIIWFLNNIYKIMDLWVAYKNLNNNSYNFSIPLVSEMYPWVSNVVLQPAMLRTHRCFKLINWSYANQKHNSNWNTCVGPQHGRCRTTFETHEYAELAEIQEVVVLPEFQPAPLFPVLHDWQTDVCLTTKKNN